ncbi:MAG: FkbM family methyltransferase [Lentisphaerae bacterium]|nr:FkbM family methyltransferase [Lentisphaerota bacterium]
MTTNGMSWRQRWTEWKRWQSARGAVRNWFPSWRIAVSEAAINHTHHHANPELPAARHQVQFRSGLKLNFAIDQWRTMVDLLYTCEQYLEQIALPLRPHDVVIDIGAHMGSFAVPLAFRVPGLTVYAYEPDPRNAALLKQNAADNGFDGSRVIVCGQAVGGAAGTHRFLQGPTSTTGTLASAGYVKNKACKPVQAIEVETVTLPAVFARHAITHCRLLKMDCEGSEYAILEQTPPDLLQQVDAMIVEAHPLAGRTPDEIAAMLKRLGFALRAHPLRNGCVEYAATRPVT